MDIQFEEVANPEVEAAPACCTTCYTLDDEA